MNSWSRGAQFSLGVVHFRVSRKVYVYRYEHVYNEANVSLSRYGRVGWGTVESRRAKRGA